MRGLQLPITTQVSSLSVRVSLFSFFVLLLADSESEVLVGLCLYSHRQTGFGINRKFTIPLDRFQ